MQLIDERDLERRAKGMAKGSPQRAETGLRIAELAKRGAWDETVIKPGAISREAMADWLTRERVELRPLGVAMAGADEFDPYKD